MNILIINDEQSRGFSNLVQNQIKKQQSGLFSLINFINIDYKQINDYVPKDPARIKDKENQLKIQKFNSIDLIFCELSHNVKPWSSQVKDLCQFILICFECKKYIFATGAFQNIIIYLCATNFENPINILNRPNGGNLKELSTFHKKFSQFSNNDYFLDQTTGDLYQYQQQENQNDQYQWIPIANIGLHYNRINNDSNQEILNIKRSWKQLYKKDLYLSSKFEQIVTPKKSYLQHQIFENIENQFIAELKSPWVMHNFNFLNEEKKFKVILESALNNQASGIQIENFIFSFSFKIDIKYPSTIKILSNFINICYKDQKKIDNKIECQNYFKKQNFKLNTDQIQHFDKKLKTRPQSSRAFQGNNNSISYNKFLNGAIKVQQENLFFDDLTPNTNFEEFLIDDVEQKTKSRPISAIQRNITNISQMPNKKQKQQIQLTTQEFERNTIETLAQKKNDKNFFNQGIVRKFLHPTYTINDQQDQKTKEIVQLNKIDQNLFIFLQIQQSNIQKNEQLIFII